mgnify:CR=1 FL=1
MCTRFAVFEAGMESAKDPKYTMAPQRRRLDERGGLPQLSLQLQAAVVRTVSAPSALMAPPPRSLQPIAA